jgi:hypothetical protein
MNIENFKMRITPKQSKIVQEVLFKNGYMWRNGIKTLSHLDTDFLIFDKEDGGIGWSDEPNFDTCTIPELTFNEFKQQYMKKEKEEDFFEKAYKSLCKMQQAKNKNYGESALKPLDIFAKHHSYGSRLDEKLARVKNSDKLRKNDVADIIGGLMLLCKDNGWDDFDDLID